jgi:hypothetical protein
VTRSKRPGSAVFGNHNNSQPTETSLGKADGKKTSLQPGKGKQTITMIETVDPDTEINLGKKK